MAKTSFELIEDVNTFTAAIIYGYPDTYLNALAETLMARNEIALDELKDLVYRRLVLLAKFCCCQCSESEEAQYVG